MLSLSSILVLFLDFENSRRLALIVVEGLVLGIGLGLGFLLGGSCGILHLRFQLGLGILELRCDGLFNFFHGVKSLDGLGVVGLFLLCENLGGSLDLRFDGDRICIGILDILGKACGITTLFLSAWHRLAKALVAVERIPSKGKLGTV